MLIPSYITDLYNTTVSDFNNYNFGVNCKLYYGTNRTICSNCIFNEGLGISTNVYKIGGSIPFSEGLCPYCFGTGFKDEQISETIKLRVYFEKKAFLKMEVPINVSDGIIQTIGDIDNMIKCRRCNYALIHSDLESSNEYRYVLASEPTPFGLTKKEFVCYWNRQQ